MGSITTKSLASINTLTIIIAVLAFTKGSHPGKCELRNDLAVILDASASVKQDGFDLAKTFTKNLVSHFSVSPNETQISLMAFSHYLRIPVKFRDLLSEKQVKAAVDRLKYEASTSSTAAALVAVQNEMFSKEGGARAKTADVKMAAVLVTDGFSGGGFNSVKDKTDIMKQYGIEIFVVALGSGTNKKELRVMASEPKQKHIFQLKEGTDVKRLVNRLVHQICKTRKLIKILL